MESGRAERERDGGFVCAKCARARVGACVRACVRARVVSERGVVMHVSVCVCVRVRARARICCKATVGVGPQA